MKPYLIQFQGTGDKEGGSLSYVEGDDLPFDIQRVYWIYGVANGDKRGGHAHKSGDRLLVCTSGSSEVSLENSKGEKYIFKLDSPSKGLVFPAKHWVNIEFLENNAVLMVLVSCTYKDDEYLKDYDLFLSK